MKVFVSEAFLQGKYRTHLKILFPCKEPTPSAFRGNQVNKINNQQLILQNYPKYFIFISRYIMKERLKMDIEFYHFAKQRLFKQWKRINDEGLQRNLSDKNISFFPEKPQGWGYWRLDNRYDDKQEDPILCLTFILAMRVLLFLHISC